MTLNEVGYCAEECARQKSGELSVYHMAKALLYAQEHLACGGNRRVNLENVLDLGRRVEPAKNFHGFRVLPVTVGGRVISANNVRSQLSRLIKYGQDFGPDHRPLDFYREFQMIHPFIDGNGRVGSVLYNLHLGFIMSPVAPPDIFA